MTQRWNVSGAAESVRRSALHEAAAMLRDGDTVAFPTETVYGLGADARNTEAVARIFEAKGRPSDNPLIVHIADRSQLEELTAPPEEAVSRLLEAFWPGPLTVVLPVRPGVLSPLVTAGLTTVGVRIPDHPVALELIAAAGCPIAAPSANRSGRPSPTRADHVWEDLAGRIGGLVDGGPTGVGVESTVVQYAPAEDAGGRPAAGGGVLHILRPGGITAAQLERTLPGVAVREAAAHRDPGEAPRAPGMKYAHYAPRGAMMLFRGRPGTAPEQVLARMQRELDEARARGERTGVLTYGEHETAGWRADCVVACGRLDDLDSVARRLYDALRAFDEAGVRFIAAEACPEDGIGAAIMNRLRKAAGDRLIDV